MSQIVNKVKVFLASPDDVSIERDAVQDSINQINRTIASDKNIVLELIKWETHAWPGIGENSQDVINNQIKFNENDIFIGIMWNRIGTPTDIAKSGTIEEFENAYNSWKKINRPKIMFYFNRKAFNPENVDEIEQKKQVLLFKEMITNLGALVWNYDDPEEFKKIIFEHLIKELRSIPYLNQSQSHSIEKLDCIILCGGYSKRLWPLTYDISKVLLPVAGTPILLRLIKKVLKSKLIKKIILSINKKFEEQLINFAKKFINDSRIEIIVETTMNEEEKLGPIGALNFIISKLGVRDYLLLGGDNLFDFEIDDFLRFAYTKTQSTNAVHRLNLYDDVSEYGVVEIDDNFIVSKLIEKQPKPDIRDISTACYLLRSKDIKLISKYLLQGRDPDSLGGFLQWLITEKSPFACFPFSSVWFDIGTREKLLQANWNYLIDSQRGRIEGNSEIKSPSQIEANSVITNSYIGSNVYIEPNVIIIESEIQDSIVMNGTEIRNSIISDSVIGPYSNINGRIYEAVCGPRTKIMANVKR